MENVKRKGKVTTQVAVRTSTGSENHENTKERKHEKAGTPEIKNGRMKT
jgi:hypothetical protein